MSCTPYLQAAIDNCAWKQMIEVTVEILLSYIITLRAYVYQSGRIVMLNTNVMKVRQKILLFRRHLL